MCHSAAYAGVITQVIILDGGEKDESGVCVVSKLNYVHECECGPVGVRGEAWLNIYFDTYDNLQSLKVLCLRTATSLQKRHMRSAQLFSHICTTQCHACHLRFSNIYYFNHLHVFELLCATL